MREVFAHRGGGAPSMEVGHSDMVTGPSGAGEIAAEASLTGDNLEALVDVPVEGETEPELSGDDTEGSIWIGGVAGEPEEEDWEAYFGDFDIEEEGMAAGAEVDAMEVEAEATVEPEIAEGEERPAQHHRVYVVGPASAEIGAVNPRI